ncbi:MAG: rhodanese-like domain-containing protein [Actinomycetota bacterium]|nr:rhodanese-like domain-containing protein [Actinomycetota bacterium]
MKTADQLLAAARERLQRVTPRQAFAAAEAGALLVDIRLYEERLAQGAVPGALVISRNHLEWRLDPTCDARIPQVTGYDCRIILFCVEGYTSSLAAAALQDMGFANATDLDGGFMAWARAGLPIRQSRGHGGALGRD